MAKITVDPTYNLEKIANDAGQADPTKRSYSAGQLIVEGVTQAALEAALSAYDDETDGLLSSEALSELQATENAKDVARKLEEVLDHLINDAPLSQAAQTWLSGRKTARGQL